MNEKKLTEKLKLIEALFAGATTDGEKDAAFNALQRIRDRLNEIKKEDPPVEYKFSMADVWSRKLFLALLRRYDIKPYRYYRQRYTTVMAKIPKSFVDETLWPEFEALNKTLRQYIEEATNKIIGETIHSDSSDAEVIKQLE
ncbi:hypothetical protein [Desulfobacter vibrioformis]|uniref:hypothetical protein n=1 Tax=Desulfobacter vibrioformis TaxID=34031 RepID=UPI0005547359|nr:hypothetical protein [Desulfobacter vibrioformis]